MGIWQSQRHMCRAQSCFKFDSKLVTICHAVRAASFGFKVPIPTGFLCPGELELCCVAAYRLCPERRNCTARLLVSIQTYV